MLKRRDGFFGRIDVTQANCVQFEDRSEEADVRADARDALTKTAEFLRNNPGIRVTIEGHCHFLTSASWT